MRRRILTWVPPGLVLLALAACGEIGPIETPPPPPSLGAVAVEANATNALSAVLTFSSARADLASATCRAGGEPDAVTPQVSVTATGGRVVVLGLSPGTHYACDVTVTGYGGSATSYPVDYQTSALPPSFTGVRLELTGTPPPGYILAEVTRDSEAATLAFDATGRIVWYRIFPARAGETAMQTEQLPNGDFTVYVGASTGWQPVDGSYIQFHPDGEIVRSFAAANGDYTDSHEMLLTLNGDAVTAAHLYGYDLRTMDLTSLGGRADQLVAGHSLQRLSPTGSPEFVWNAWDHFTLADWIFVPPNLSSYQSIDFDHPNSMALDRDGNYIVSFASLGEITKINAQSGAVLWRLGGRHNQFTFVNDPLGGFGFQHDVRVLSNGDLLFFDNGLAHAPKESRAVEYRLDPVAGTATLVWQYRHTPALFNPFVGSVQRFRSGNTLIGYGALSSMTEVAPDGTVLWEGRLTVDGAPVPYFYRARRIASLYRHEDP